ncbi:MAG: zf-HC2 domain-containing protein [Acidobacteria bacterium]|nr:zf-HC2 domain-containing protein [Acidobacteriota bacterium]
MRTCDLFDKYRDGELKSAEQAEFKSHLTVCEACRTRMALLNNLVSILKQEESRPLDLANRIAQKAFAKDESLSSLVVSWLHPGTAWAAALSMMLLLLSFLWATSGKQQFDTYSEYLKLMDDEAAINLSISASMSQVRTDSEVMLWLAQGGESQ